MTACRLLRVVFITPLLGVKTVDARPVSQRMTTLEWIMLLSLSGTWASAFYFNSIIAPELPTLTTVCLRLLFGWILLLAILRLSGLALPMTGRAIRYYFTMGLLNNCIPLSLILWGQSQIGAALASILNATTPLAAIILAHAFTPDDKMTSRKLAGAVLGFLGVTLLVGPTYLAGLQSDFLGQLACLTAAVSYASAGVYARSSAKTLGSPLCAATGQLIASTVILAPFALFYEHAWALDPPSARGWAAIAGLAIIATAISYVLYFKILASAGVTNLMLVAFLIPLNVVLANMLFGGAWLEPRYYQGMLFIGLGLAAIDGRLVDRLVAWRRRLIARL